MSEPENFIARWSRRKRDAAQERTAEQDAEATKAAVAPDAAVAGARPPEHQDSARDAEPAHGSASEPAAFDPTKLPPIESIAADSDIRPFLAPGVPLELTRAALRRAWSADPAIRDYVGLSENAWDFTAPDSVPGFGPLEMTDELRRQIARMVGRGLAGEERDRPAPTPPGQQAERPSVDPPAESAATTAEAPTQAASSNRGSSQSRSGAPGREAHNSEVALHRNKVAVASQYDPESPDNDQVIAKRSHGSALPK
jgi:hypothetical protein